MANWDPSYLSEKVDWYGEYVARHASISVSWLQQPTGDSHGPRERREIRGLGFLSAMNHSKVVAPLDDGSVCLWEVGHNDNLQDFKRGSIIARSKPGLLSVSGPSGEIGKHASLSEAKMTSTGVIECVSVDSARNKAYFAAQSGLNEVDLETLQLTSHESYPYPISALSEASYPVPLTVGTTLSLHLHDPRLSNNSRSTSSRHTERVESVAAFPVFPRYRDDFYRLLTGDQLPEHGPLSILHLPFSDSLDTSQGEIYLAGRFPSILTYDRRFFPKLKNTIHSGARLCSLTSVSHPFVIREGSLARQTQPPTIEDKSRSGKTLIAGGEYNGKGSLEIYGLSSSLDDPAPVANLMQPDQVQQTAFKNRVSASRSKLLSVATHGTRIVYSDLDGMLTWVERDGFTLVRQWNINRYVPVETRGLFTTSRLDAGSGDVVRKILALDGKGRVERDELLVWTGENVGVLGFKEKARFGRGEWDEWKGESEKERKARREEEFYGEMMKRTFERQANEVRFVQGLGIGTGRA